MDTTSTIISNTIGLGRDLIKLNSQVATNNVSINNLNFNRIRRKDSQRGKKRKGGRGGYFTTLYQTLPLFISILMVFNFPFKKNKSLIYYFRLKLYTIVIKRNKI